MEPSALGIIVHLFSMLLNYKLNRLDFKVDKDIVPGEVVVMTRRFISKYDGKIDSLDMIVLEDGDEIYTRHIN